MTDRPAHVCRLLTQRARDHRDQDGEGEPFPTEHAAGFNAGLTGASTWIHFLEKRDGVTFIALPTEALAALRVEWEEGSDEDLRMNSVRMIRDLFGGQDGHLTRIDRTLGPRLDRTR